MGAFGSTTPSALPSAPKSPDATDLNLLAARRARAMSLFSLGRGFGSDFITGQSGTKAQGGPVTYGLPESSLLGGATQFGDETGTNAAPSLAPPPKVGVNGKPLPTDGSQYNGQGANGSFYLFGNKL